MADVDEKLVDELLDLILTPSRAQGGSHNVPSWNDRRQYARAVYLRRRSRVTPEDEARVARKLATKEREESYEEWLRRPRSPDAPLVRSQGEGAVCPRIAWYTQIRYDKDDEPLKAQIYGVPEGTPIQTQWTWTEPGAGEKRGRSGRPRHPSTDRIAHGILHFTTRDGSRMQAGDKPQIAQVEWTYVNENIRGCGVGTQLYDQLAALSCELGLPIASDTVRVPIYRGKSSGAYASEKFWQKQLQKGRAKCLWGRGKHPRQDDLDIPEDARCDQYVMKRKCMPPGALDGVPGDDGLVGAIEGRKPSKRKPRKKRRR